jgi:hypothetical protein
VVGFGTFRNALAVADRGAGAATRPRRSRSAGGETAGQLSELAGMRIARGEGEADAALQLLDADRDLHEGAPDRLERGAAPDRAARHRRAQRMQEPVGTHVQEEPELIGLPAVAGGLVGARVELQVLDQVLGSAACAVDLRSAEHA